MTRLSLLLLEEITLGHANILQVHTTIAGLKSLVKLSNFFAESVFIEKNPKARIGNEIGAVNAKIKAPSIFFHKSQRCTSNTVLAFSICDRYNATTFSDNKI